MTDTLVIVDQKTQTVLIQDYPTVTLISPVVEIVTASNAGGGIAGIVPISSGGTGASDASDAIFNLIDGVTEINKTDMSLTYFPVIDYDNGVSGKISVDSAVGNALVEFGYPNGAVLYGDDQNGIAYDSPGLYFNSFFNRLAVGHANPTATLHTKAGSITEKAMILQANVSQTANMIEIQNSSGAVQAAWNKSGYFYYGSALWMHNASGAGGVLNTCIGDGTGNNTMTQTRNTLLGARAGAALTTGGGNNVAIGYQALTVATTSQYNVAIGSTCLSALTSGDFNVAMGAANFPNLVTGTNNINLGIGCYNNATSASLSIGVGSNAGKTITSPNQCTLVGTEIFSNATTAGISVTAMGIYIAAAGNMTTAQDIVAVGRLCINNATTFTNGVAIGNQAGEWMTGTNCTVIGHMAGNNGGTLRTGNQITLLGASSGLSGNFSNCTALGYSAQAGASNVIILGGTGASKVRGGIGITAPLAKFHVQNETTTDPTEIIQAVASQTANQTEWRNSGGSVLSAIKPDGSWQPPSMADSSATNNSLYYSTTASKLVFKDAGGTVNALY